VVRCSSFARLGDEVLHCERVSVLHPGVVIVIPALECILVEYDIARHVNLAICWIVQPVCLAPGFIPDEDHLQSSVIQLGEVWARDLHVGDAAEHSQMVHRRFLAVQASYGVLPSTLCDGDRLRMYTAVTTASPQNLPGIPAAFIIDLAVPTMV
jgi:hypothetical protein